MSANIIHREEILIRMSKNRTGLVPGKNVCRLQLYPRLGKTGRNHPTSYLQGVEVAACVLFHIKVMDGELDTTPWGSADVPDTLFVVGIVERVPRAAEGACDSRHLPTTACWTHKKLS